MTRKLLAALLFVAGCSTAHADQIAAPAPRTPIAIASAPTKIRAPYDVQIVRDNGEVLPTYAARDRFYVQGTAGERYILRISNPTPNRVEAVVTVDGLDVIDGEAGDLKKRGYIVPAYGETRVEGFRTSADDVATFRFSAVDDSYAGKQGKARNVGVVAVALFEEQAPPQIVEPAPPPRVGGGGYRYEDDVDGDAAPAPAAPAAQPSPADKAPPASRIAPAAVAPPPPPPPAPPRAMKRYEPSPSPTRQPRPDADEAQRTNRPGLGTEYGEQRYSSVMYTRFERAPGRPIAVAELRYNDAPGLLALGIQVAPMPDEGEIMTRETADPFPGGHYALPPR